MSKICQIPELSVKNVFNNQGEVLSKNSVTQFIREVVKNLGTYTSRPLDLYLNEISEITTKLEKGYLIILFRIGIIYCEIKSFFNANTLILKETVLGVRY